MVLVFEIGHENVKVSILVVIARRSSHPGPKGSILAGGDSLHHSDIAKLHFSEITKKIIRTSGPTT